MAYRVGYISERHFNRAVTLGLWSAGRCASQHVLPYIVAQVVAAVVAAGVLWIVASGKAGWVPGGFASSGYGDLSPGKYGLAACFLTEVVLTGHFRVSLPERALCSIATFWTRM
jgi:aquaporin Z